MRSISIEEISRLSLIGYRNQSCHTLTTSLFDKFPEGPDFVFRSDDNGTIQGCVGAGLAHALVALLTVDVDDPATVVVPIEPAPPPRRIHIVWLGDRKPGSSQQAFVDVVAEVCADLGRTDQAA